MTTKQFHGPNVGTLEDPQLQTKTLQAQLADALIKRDELFTLWQRYLSAQKTIDEGGFHDNYTDVARARDVQQRVLNEARALIGNIEGSRS